MRIVCEKCAAAYAIDDRLISARGVRAQCPRCRHLQFVTRESALAAQQAQRHPATTPVCTPVLPPEALPGSPSMAPRIPSAAPKLPAASGKRPGAAAPKLPDWDALPPPPPAPPPREVDDSLLSPRGGGRTGALSGCRDCGQPLTDPFDQALGICPGCREKAAVTPPPTVPAAPVKPVAPRQPTPAPAPSSKPRPTPDRSAVLTAARPKARVPGRPWKWIALGVALVLVAGGAGAFLLRGNLFPHRDGAVQKSIPPAIAAVLPGWRMANVDVSGTAAAHLELGQKLLREDRAAGYEQAIEEFQKALILDPGSDEAIAGYAEALALGRGARVDDGAFEQALSLLTAAEKRSSGAAEVLLARATLLLTRPQDPAHLQQARALAGEALKKTEDSRAQARAHLVIGESWQSSSSPLAVESFSRALALDPGLRVAWYQRALANESSGDFGPALADLRKRLELDPQHWASNAELARIYRDAGRIDLARQVYQRILEKQPDLARARLELAVFRYQAEGKTSEALGELHALAQHLGGYDNQDQVEILAHLATAERIAGNENAAVQAAQRALKISPQDPAPQLQLYLIALGRGLTTDAEKSFAGLQGRLGDAGLEKLLEGRLRMMESRWSEAVACFDQSLAADARRIDAQLLAGLAAARGNEKDVALAHLFAAAKADPARAPPVPAASRLYFQPLLLLRGMEGQLPKLASGPEEVLPRLYEAVLRYHLGQPAQTAKLTVEVTDRDTNNALAHAWHAFALLAQGEKKAAARSALHAVEAGRQLALAQYARGAVLAESGQDEEARRALGEALRLDPSLPGAQQRLAELEVQGGEESAARERLAHLLSLDPSWQPARQLLFSLEKEDDRAGADSR